MISVNEAKLHCRVDNSDEDSWFSALIDAVSQAVIFWVGDEKRVYELEENSDGELVPIEDTDGIYLVKPIVKAAVMLEVARQYQNREGAQNEIPESWGHGYTLGIGATQLLTPIRKVRVS